MDHESPILLDTLASRVLGPAAGASVRWMRPEDLGEVLRIIRLHDSDDYKAAKASFSKARFDLPVHVTAHLVAQEPGTGHVVGVCGYYVDDLEAQGLYWLGWTYVNPFHRGQGHGSTLMKVVLALVQDLGGRKMYLSTSGLPKYKSAVSFYERHGFATEGRLVDFYADGEDQLIMGRTLQDQASALRKQSRIQAISPQPSPAPSAPLPEDEKVVFDF